MMNNKQIRKIARTLNHEGDSVNTRIKTAWYKVRLCADNRITLTPFVNGDVACSTIEPDALQYINGGEIFRAAVDVARALENELKRKRAGPTDENNMLELRKKKIREQILSALELNPQLPRERVVLPILNSIGDWKIHVELENEFLGTPKKEE